jgi:L-alanine-DL-glutamate epimerase-like enolase superfamily enzyme
MRTDIRIKEARVSYEEDRLRTPLVLATGPIREVTRARVDLVAETRDGRVARGVGEMCLSDAWGFPSTTISHEARDAVMRRLTEQFAAAVVRHTEPDHPIGLFEDVLKDLDGMRKSLSREAGLPEEMPRLGALVCASAVDLAVHDAFGRALGLDSYAALGLDHGADLGRWLGPGFAGRSLLEFIHVDPDPALPVIHLVGGGDKLTAAERDPSDPDDGFPVTLEEWIERDGVFQFKVKIKGYDLAWDLERITAVHRVARSKGCSNPILTVDTNERCESPQYAVDLLDQLAEKAPEAYAALVLFEQPTERDLSLSRHDQRPLAARRPVLVDEGLTDPDGLDLAVELGWSGVAFKVCKGLSSTLLVLARARTLGMTGAVMDLTLPGIPFIHSAGFAARIQGRYGLEANGRQYLPHACPEISAQLPNLFRVRNGFLSTREMGRIGLGAPD